MSGYAPDYGSSAPEGALDPDLIAAFATALQLHEGRWLVLPKIITVKVPAAGADWTQQVPSGVTWIPFSITGQFAASAAVATRVIAALIGDGSSAPIRIRYPSNAAAGQTLRFSLIRGAGSASGGSADPAVTGQLGFFVIPGGWVVQSSTVNIDVADQWSNIFLYVLEVRERTPNERAEYVECLMSGRPTTDYPGILLGL